MRLRTIRQSVLPFLGTSAFIGRWIALLCGPPVLGRLACVYIRIYNKKVDKDPDKEDRNVAERGLSLDLAESLDWATALIWEDTRKDYGERRYCVLGFIDDRLHSVVFTPRSGKPRVISLRKADKREVKRYEKATEIRKSHPR